MHGVPNILIRAGFMLRSFQIACVMLFVCVGQAEADICGVGSYRCCPVETCAAASSYTACQVQTVTAWKTVCETVYEPEEYTTKKVVYEPVYEPVQQTTYRIVTETAYRDEEYTVCRPVSETKSRTESWCVQIGRAHV